MQYIDLSVLVDENTPVYPGDPKVTIVPAGIFAQDGFNDHTITLGTHVGTHIDAPLHMIENGKSFAEFPISHFVGRGIYIDARNGYDLKSIKSMDIQAGDIVLIHTGMAEKYLEEGYFEDLTPIPEDIARYLTACRINIVGIDMGSPDHEPFMIHKIFLGKDVLIIENLTNLDALAGKEFKIFALPMKLNLDGAPVRVVAEIS